MPDKPTDGNGSDDLKTYLMDSSEWPSASNPVAEKTPPSAQTSPTNEPFSLLTPPSAVTPGSGSRYDTPSGGTSEYEIPFKVASDGLQIKVGTELFDDYVVEEKLGEGGMGSVWKVLNKDLGTSTALKLIVETNFTEDARARLKREAQLMALLKHENAVEVKRSKVRTEFAFIEMEYLRGNSLDKMLERGRPKDLGWIARILDQLCAVLEYAHERVVDHKGRKIKIVHRDLKPSNLMILDDQSGGPYHLKVLDFGIAKKVELQASGNEAGEFRTSTGGGLFTLPYASPEQIGGQRDITEKADVYSVGVMLYEFLTGYRPFEEPGLIYKQISLPPPSFRDRNPSVVPMPDIEDLVMRCLSKNPTERPSARELADEFMSLLPPDLIIPSKPSGRSSAGYLRVPGSDSRIRSLTAAQYNESANYPTERINEARGSDSRTQAGTSSRPSWKDDGTKPRTKQATSTEPEYPRTRKKQQPPPVGLILGGIVLLCGLLAGGLYFAFKGTTKKEEITVTPTPQPPPAAMSLIPAGYEEVAGQGKNGEYPRVIQRTGSKVRFMYMPTASFKFGTDRNSEAFATRMVGVDAAAKPRPVETDDTMDDLPQREVMVTHFYIQETEVTNGEIAPYLTKRPLKERDLWERSYNLNTRGMEDKPAVFITKETAEAYAHSIGCELPSELQWEYTARSAERSFRPYVWNRKDLVPGQVRDDLNIEVALVRGQPVDEIRNSKDSRHDSTEYQVLGLMGNVREWCLDVWAPYPTEDAVNRLLPKRDPVNLTPFGKLQSVVRGASYRSMSERCQTTWPRRLMAEFDRETLKQVNETGCADDIGFRLVLKLPEPTTN